MPNPLAIDAHAHICTEETMKLLNKETPKVASALKDIGDNNYEWTVCGVPYRPLPLGGFDIQQRLKDMKASDVDMQVLSNTPQTFMYNQDAGDPYNPTATMAGLDWGDAWDDADAYGLYIN